MRPHCRNHAFALVLSLVSSGALYGQSGERIVVDGSTGVTPLVAALAKAYQEQNPGASVEIGKGMGTKARIKALTEGKIDIAMASHGLNVEEITRQGMAVNEIAKVAVVFGVNASVSATGLADRQICDIYSQKLGNWSELGSPDLAIAPLTRPDTEVDTEVVRAKIGCLKDLRMPDTAAVMPKGGDMAKGLAATSGAIGMTTMTVVEQSGGRIRQVSLNGVAPSAENVRKGAYALTRDSFLVTKAPPSPTVAKFLEFIRSPAGEQVILTNGAVPAK
ncbi:MAG: substrate-binding domain-containing protein [Betaproteobacteria bacterium]|nr:substrate-binding domain-containing protein [Betaproteobacteria bacterium]